MSNGQFSSSILFNRSEPSAIAGVTEGNEEPVVSFSPWRQVRWERKSQPGKSSWNHEKHAKEQRRIR
jgi:hypothetical protein